MCDLEAKKKLLFNIYFIHIHLCYFIKGKKSKSMFQLIVCNSLELRPAILPVKS